MADDEDPGVDVPAALPQSPSGRIPKWVIDEALEGRAPEGRASEGRAPEATPSRGRPQRRGAPGGWTSRLPAAVTVAVVVGLLGWALLPGRLTSPVPSPSTATTMVSAPSPGREEAPRPLGAPAAAAGASTAYRFFATQADGRSAVAYDPCRPVHFVIRPDGAPAGGQSLLTEALRRVSAATGLQFHDDGTTTEAPSKQRESFQRTRYGDRWAPVLIAWDTPTENPDFATDVAGEAGSVQVSVPGRPTVFVTGQVELDAGKLSGMLTRPGGRDLVRAVILHELGHLVGLGHVDDATQLMYPVTGKVIDYAPGDLAGLAALGRGGCVPAV
jgi:hypothetical protein